MRTTIFVNHIGHYHHARFEAYARSVGDVTVLAAVAEAAFSEFSAGKEWQKSYSSRTLYATNSSYADAVRCSSLSNSVDQALQDLDPHVVVISGWAAPEGLAGLAWARTNKRAVVLMSESQESDAIRSAVREFVKGRIVKACDAALVGGETHVAYLAKLGMLRHKIFLGYDVVDNAHFAAGAERARADDAIRTALKLPKRYFLASGRFVRKKNFATLIRAHSMYVREGAATHDLVILGDGPERASLELLVEQLGMRSRVHLPGFREYDILPYYYGLASLFVHPSTTEQWGLVVNEAMAAGLPVLVTPACGSANLIVNGRNGFVFDPHDVRSLAGHLARLAANEADCKRWGAAAQHSINRWDPPRFAEGLSTAASFASRQPKRPLQLWDKLLVKYLARRSYDTVA